MAPLGLSLLLMRPLPLTAHLSLARKTESLGFDRVWSVEIARINAAWKAGDRARAGGAVSDRFLDGLGAVGAEAFCRERIAQHGKAGLGEPMVFPFAPVSAPLPTVLRTARAFTREASRSAS